MVISRLSFCAILLCCLVLAVSARPIQAAGLLALVSSESAETEVEIPPADTIVWTTWGANQYRLVDDGESLWIGATGGIVRWDKQGQGYRRYSAVDRLPHTVVLAVAVDQAGNRWFGGDGGLSRLDPAERWTHFTTANSGIHANCVDGIAVDAEGALYLSHGLPDGSISRLATDGAWEWYPNREVAIMANYAAIRQESERTPLWTVIEDEIWAGYWAYDGVMWHDRTPSLAWGCQPSVMAADSRNHLWVLATGSSILEWDGANWVGHFVGIDWGGQVTALAVAPDDTVWIGLQRRVGNPYTSETAQIRPLQSDETWSLYVSGPVTDLLFTPEGLWGVGPGWLATPNRTIVFVRDAPHYKVLPDALADSAGNIWLYSGYTEPYTVGALQTFDDNGTAALHDDHWRTLPDNPSGNPGQCEWLGAWDRSPNGDVWYAGYCHWRVVFPDPIVRYHGQERIEYRWPSVVFTDIFVQDDRHVWFAAQGQVDALDDGGTPADSSDDVWQSWKLPQAGEHPVVAVDADDSVWYGDANGLYRYDGSAWLPIYTELGICDLAPGDGVLYAHLVSWSSGECEPYAGRVLVVRSGGVDWIPDIEYLIAKEPASVRTASRRNTLWAVAPDGALWTIGVSDSGPELRRQDATELRVYPLPVDTATVQRLEVDAANRAWLVANNQLWRMSRQVDFSLEAQPAVWLLAPGRSREGKVSIFSHEGYKGSVSLSVVEPPAGITVRFGSEVIAAGQAGSLTLVAAPDSAPATHHLVIRASDGVITHTAVLLVKVTAVVHETYLPVASKRVD